jgi:hypothetical protein
VAFLAAGRCVTFFCSAPFELIERAMTTPAAVRALNYSPSIGNFLTMTLLSFCAIMLLPRQFHVSVVENSSDAEVSRARWAVSAVSGRHQPVRDPDCHRRSRDLSARRGRQRHVRAGAADAGQSDLLSVGVFVGGLSAATAMVIVECVALSIMVSNDIVVPLVLQRGRESRAGAEDFGDFLLRFAALRFSPSW